jgi:hypothetical protein
MDAIQVANLQLTITDICEKNLISIAKESNQVTNIFNKLTINKLTV